MARQITQEALNLLKHLEGCRLTVYLDVAGYPTVGYGHRTLLPPGSHILQQTADDILGIDIGFYEEEVASLVDVPLNDNQFSALVLFTFNVGEKALMGSTLLRKLNAGDYQGAADEFLRWDKAGGHVVEGLHDRRVVERNLFLKAHNG